MSKMMEFYTKDDAASEQIGADVYRRVSIPIDDFNAACDHYGFVKEWTCKVIEMHEHVTIDEPDIAELSCGHDIMVFDMEPPKFCSECGAKVVEG